MLVLLALHKAAPIMPLDILSYTLQVLIQLQFLDQVLED